MAVNYGSLPFKQKIDLYRAKVSYPTERWNDLQREQHDTGFMVAGAIKADLLADLKEAIRKAIEDGATLRDFRKDFDKIVAKHGWTGWTGSDSAEGKAWRTRVIYETNLRSAYQAGRWQQLQDGKADRPYLIYRHSHSVITPRAEHVAWDGLIVHIDDPWVQTHYPPNGYGCKCTMFGLSKRDLLKLGKTGPDTPPNDGTYEWTDKVTGEVHTFPKGIQPFWDYAPGASLDTRLKDLLRRKSQALPKDMSKAFKAGLDLLKQDINEKAALKLGVKSVDYAGRKDIADFVTPIFLSLSERGLPLPDHILTDHATVVRLAAKTGDDPDKIVAAFVLDSQAKQTHIVLNPASLYWTKPQAAAQAAFANDRFWSTNRADHAVLHEMGHLSHYLHVPFGYIGLAKAVFTPEQTLIALKVSRYAAESPREFIAETFVLLQEGVSLEADIMALYDQYGGRRP